MTVDWESLHALNLDELDDDRAEVLYDQLIEFAPETEDNVTKLRLLLSAAKCVMQVKALQADVAVEELEELSKKRYNKGEVETLRNELKMYKEASGGPNKSDISSGMKRQLEAKDKELAKCERKLNDFERQAEEADKEIDELRAEIDSLRDELDTQRQEIDEQLVKSQEPIEKLREKNKQIEDLLDELKEMEGANQKLDTTVKQLKAELQDATKELDFSGDELKTIQTQLAELSEFNQELLKEKEFFFKETDELRSKLVVFESEDEAMVAKFSEQVDSLISLMNEKDAELKILRESDQSGRRTKEFYKERPKSELLKARDEEIELLKGHLEVATKEMEEQTKVMEQLQRGHTGKGSGDTGGPNHELKEKYEQLHQELQSLEEQLKVKGTELIEVKSRNVLYEKYCYGLSEAVQEITQLQRTIAKRDKKLEVLAHQLNEQKLELSDTLDELEYVRECVRMKDIDPTFDPRAGRTQSDKLKILKLQQLIVKLEEDKISLSEEARALRAARRRDQGLTDQEDEDRVFQKRIHELENENGELQLGMREILIGIHESDARSDVVIDCPSLERVCGLLESRSLSAQLTNVISLKAELDLLRGHNEQLRSDLKRLRCEHIRLLAVYTEDVLGENNSKSDDNSGPLISEGEIPQQPSAQEPPSEGEFVPGKEFPRKEPRDTFEDEDDDEEQKEKKKKKKHEHRGNAGDGNGQVFRRDEADDDGGDQSQAGPPINGGNNDNDGLRADQGRADDAQREEESTDIFTQTDPMSWDTNLPGAANETLDEISSASVSVIKCEAACQTDAAMDAATEAISLPQTEAPAPSLRVHSPGPDCPNCLRVVQTFEEVQSRLGKLERSVTASDEAYAQQVRRLQDENSALASELRRKLDDRENVILEKESQMRDLKEQIKRLRNQTVVVSHADMSEAAAHQQHAQSQAHLSVSPTPSGPSKSCGEMLTTIIDCLQARIVHKDDSIREYQRLLEQTKESFEREMRAVLERQVNNQDLKSIDFQQLIDNDELQKALEKCITELERCRLDSQGKCEQLSHEIEQYKRRCDEFRTENEHLRSKSSYAHLAMAKKELEKAQLENEEKDRTIERLNKSLRDERTMRIGHQKSSLSPKLSRAGEKAKSGREELIKEIGLLNEQLEHKNKLIKELEVCKWDFEKRIQETVELYQEKIKDKSEEVARLEKMVDKTKRVLDKSEKDRLALDIKSKKIAARAVSAKDNRSGGADQRPKSSPKSKSRTVSHWADDSNRFDSERADYERKIECLREELEHSKESEDELKILLRESVQREKLATIKETMEEVDIPAVETQLLQENAHLKVELRMAEFELKRKASLTSQ